MKTSKHRRLFHPVKVDVQCGKDGVFSRKGVSNVTRGSVLFFKTQAPIEPVSFVHQICTDAFEAANVKKHRWIRRLTPMSQMGKATEKGLDAVSHAVLGPKFHQEGIAPQKVCDPVFHFTSY